MRFLGRNQRNNRSAYGPDHQQQPSVVDSQEFQHQTEVLIPAEIRLISGCHSEQTSADVSNINSIAKLPNPAGRAGGACTSALLEILYRRGKHGRDGSEITFQDLLLELRRSLGNKGLEQIPQLTSSRPLELRRTPFSLVGQPSGQRRALLVGINYIGQNGELSGCHNDVFNVKEYIIKEQHFSERNITLLVDDGRHSLPTRRNIIAALQMLVQQSKAGDSVYVHYSGHGGLLSPENFNAFKFNNPHPNGEKNYDETLFPVDHQRSGQIRDFSLFHHFVQPMAAGVVVTCIMDCCHSGAVLDLPYSFQPTPQGTIQMRENMSSLSNLAFLYILAGGILPHGFESVNALLDSTLEDPLDSYYGTGVEEIDNDHLESDFDTEVINREAFDNTDDYDPVVVPAMESSGFFPEGPLVQGVDVSPEVFPGYPLGNAGEYGMGNFGDNVDYSAGGYDFVEEDRGFDFRAPDDDEDQDCGCGEIFNAFLNQDE